MFYSLRGSLAAKKDNFVVLDVGGVCYKMFTNYRTLQALPALNQPVQAFCYLHVKEDALELYGFLKESDLNFFEKLLTVNGVGPKTALGVMSVAPVEKLMAAITEGKSDLLTRASGIGRKTAERIILELRGKLVSIGTAGVVANMESDLDVEEALVGLGYTRSQAKSAVARIDAKTVNLEGRLKEALKKVRKT